MDANRHPQHYRLIDLFAGAGGMTLGFTKAFGNPFVPVWANDFNKYAARTYNANFGPHCTDGDIVSILEDESTEIPAADVVIGGPPCQGFSLLNKNRENDPRKQLWRPYLEIVERSGAQVFVMENVPQLLGSAEHHQIEELAQSMGFQVVSVKLCAADYGVPQVRWRAFIVGCKFADPSRYFPPEPTHTNRREYRNGNGRTNGNGRAKTLPLFEDTLMPWTTVRDAISDLPEPEGATIRDEDPPLDLHFHRNPTPLSQKRYRAIPEEGMNRFDLQRLAPDLTPDCWIRKEKGGTDLFGRMWWDRPSFTIRTEFYKPEKGRYLHPVQHRPITHREAARLQSFPDSFRFTGTKIEIARQIGNAVPPLLAASVAASIAKLLEARENPEDAG